MPGSLEDDVCHICDQANYGISKIGILHMPPANNCTVWGVGRDTEFLLGSQKVS